VPKRRSKTTEYLFTYIKENISLPDLIEVHVGENVKWMEPDHKASMICPMPNHKDSKPSFHIKRAEDNEKVWLYNCFGCGSCGTIIDFCMDYYELGSPLEAVNLICEKYELKDQKDLVVQGIKNLKKTLNVKEKTENQNIIISNNCRILLKEDYNRYKDFVSNSYKTLNRALEDEDLDLMQDVSDEVFDKLKEMYGV
jgi:DNA primase